MDVQTNVTKFRDNENYKSRGIETSSGQEGIAHLLRKKKMAISSDTAHSNMDY